MSDKEQNIINWFPGHMTKSLREIESNLTLADVVIYVLDSRAPFSCLNPSFDSVVRNKPIVYVLNKADLVPFDALKVIVGKLSRENRYAVAVNATASNSTKVLMPIIEKLAQAKVEKYKAKGLNASLRGMVIGVPNCGKSTLINNAAAKAKTKTGNKPGVTRGQQWVRVNEKFELLDTPGTLYPKLINREVGLNLAFIGSVKDEVVDSVELAAELIKTLFRLDKNALVERYGIEFAMPLDVEFVLESIAVKRGFLIRGGEKDLEKAAKAIIDDFRKGRLGKIILDDYKRII